MDISVKLCSVAQLCPTLIPWTAASQAFLSITNSQSSLKLMSIELMMPSPNFCCDETKNWGAYTRLTQSSHPLSPPSLAFNLYQHQEFESVLSQSVWVSHFSNESVVCIRRPKYWSFNFSISPSNECPGLISFRIDWLDLLAV